MRSKSCLQAFAALSLLAASSFAAGATAQRTYVSSSGTANPSCSRAAPCRNFTDAIPATSTGGEVIVLDSAGYGPVMITKSVSIIAPPGIYAGISVFSGNGVTVNAPGVSVVLRGLSINGQGGANGILVQQAARVRIENCVVSNIGAQGIYHQADNAEVIVLDTISRDNGDGGFALVAKDASIVLDHVRSEHNVNVGFYAAPVPGASFVAVTISDRLFANNGGNGIWADSVGSAQTNVTVERTTVTGGLGDGIEATSGAAGSSVYLMVKRSTFSGNSGDGVHALGIVPGYVAGNVSEISVDNKIKADGSGAHISASGNIAGGIDCEGGAALSTYGDNHFDNIFVIGCFVTHVPSY